ncbi:MAG: CBS domain-containing protein [Syntrophorhabdales bacterium]|jgi:CBS domain-containing protein/anti-sigma regulatory factor (Ser/Thr protein kinase)
MKESIQRLPRAKKTQQLSYRLRIGEAMNKKVLTLTSDHTMMDVRMVLRDHRISGVPIVQSGRLLGIVSIEDLINCLRSGAMEKTVKDVMTSDVVTLFADEPLIQAINKFGKHGFGRFPVLDRTTGKVVGIITKKDIIQCLLKTLQSLYHAKESRRKPLLETGRLLTDLPSDGTALTLKYAVQGGDFRKAGEKSDQLKESLLKLGYSDDEIRRLIIAVLEAEMNLVIFAGRGEICAQIEPRRISVKVTDEGPGIPDIELAMRPGYSTAPDFVRELGFGAGMGLPNIKSSTDEMKIESLPGRGTNLEFSVVLK